MADPDTPDPVVVVDPDPHWPALYAEEEARLRAAFGPVLRAVEHVGSTAVPGLAAKPVIDVMVAVEALDAAPLGALAALGYVRVPTDMAGRLVLVRPPQGRAPRAHLHVVALDTWAQRKERRFRDRLRENPGEAAAYGALKRRLAARHGADRDAYTRAKTALIQAIMDRAADEAGRPREEVWE